MGNLVAIAKWMKKSRACRPIVLSLLFILVISIQTYPVEALTFTDYNAVSTASVQTPPVTLGQGTKGSVTIPSAGTSADVTVTAEMAFNENANAEVVTSLTTPSIDASVISSEITGLSGSVSLSTTSVEDIIYVVISILGTSSTVDSVTNSGAALNWIQRANVLGSAGRIETYYAVTSTAFSGQITVTLSSSASFEFTAIAIKDASITAPFDPNLQSSQSSTGSASSTTSASVTVTTKNPNDFIIGALEVSWIGAKPDSITSGSGFTLIGSLLGSGVNLGLATEYKTVTTQQNSASVDFTITLPKKSPPTISWVVIADAIQGKLPDPTTNTAYSTPASSGSFTLDAGSSALLWSPAYTSSQTLDASNWALHLWAETVASTSTMNFMLLALDSSGANTAVIASGSATTVTSVKQDVYTTFSGSSAQIESGGRLLIILTNTGGKTMTIYWGTGQVTNFGIELDYDYILTVTNGVVSSYSVSVLAQDYSSVDRLSELTVSIHDLPSGGTTTHEITIVDGVFTLSNGPTVTLPASTTYYIALNAKANAAGASQITLLLKSSPGTGPFSYYTINLTVN